MAATTTAVRPSRQASDATGVLSLDAVERSLSAGRCYRPDDAVLVRETARALHAMSVHARHFATLVCEPAEGGMRIVDGQESLLAARMLRARAVWRGEHHWADELGHGLRFRIVRKAAR